MADATIYLKTSIHIWLWSIFPYQYIFQINCDQCIWRMNEDNGGVSDLNTTHRIDFLLFRGSLSMKVLHFFYKKWNKIWIHIFMKPYTIHIFLLPRSLSLVTKISFLACDVAVQVYGTFELLVYTVQLFRSEHDAFQICRSQYVRIYELD